MKKYSLLVFGILILIIVFVYRSWFLSNVLVGGDWGYIHSSQFSSFALVPSAWETMFNLGYSNTPFIWTGILLHLYINVFGKLVNFNNISLFGFFIPFLFIGIYSIRTLLKEIGIQNHWAILLGTVIYIANTYILAVVGGGQILICLSYALVPLTFVVFMRLIHEAINLTRNTRIYSLIIYAGFILAAQVLFDLRIAYVTLTGIGIYFIYYQIFAGKDGFSLRNLLLSVVFVFLSPIVIAIFLHAVWLIPVFMDRVNPIQQLGAGFFSANAVKYFSFANLENTFSLLHPNWPENIFGKVIFMNPAFIVIPIFSYSALLFLRKKTKNNTQFLIILFFALLGIISAFLAKGVNEPLGTIYMWLFLYFPGFVMFRDPTKWYTLVAISYSVLIAFTSYKIYEVLKSHARFTIFNLQFSVKSKIFNFQNLFLILATLYLIFLIRPAILGQLTGTFKTTAIPSDYVKLENFLSSDTKFYRTLWVPSLQRFGYYSNNHPAINGKDFFNVGSLRDVVKILKKPDSRILLQEAGVKYVVIPYDSEGEIFVKDRRYSEDEYRFAVEQLYQISWLKKYKSYGKIIVFDLSSSKDHFWAYKLDNSVSYKMISPSEYLISIRGVEQNKTVIFSESYDPRWMAKVNDKMLPSQKFHKLFNSFSLSGNQQNIRIFFEPQEWVNNSLWISLITLLGFPLILVFLKIRKNT